MRTKDHAYAGELAPDLEALLDLLPQVAPGKRTRSERLPARPSAELPPHSEHHGASPALLGGADPFGVHLPGSVQLRATGAAATGDVHAAAAAGLAEPSTSLPFLDEIQASFGAAHDVRSIHAHVGGAASPAAAAMGAAAYAAGEHVAFAAAPDLHTAAHEAAHVVQQRAGVSLAGGVGAVGDSYERAADAVADAVVRGESAAALLGSPAPRADASPGSVQRKALATVPAASSAIPLLEASPSLVRLGNVTVGKPRTAQVQVTNREPSSIELVDLLASPAGLQGWIIGPRTLAPDEATVVTVTYEPTAAGTLRGKLTLITADGSGFDIPVEAEAKAFGPQLPPSGARGPAKTPAPAPVADDEPAVSVATPSPLSASPNELTFDEKIQGDVSSLISLTNTGPDPVSIDSVSIAGGEPGLVATLLGDSDLVPGAATSVAIDYRIAAYTGEPATLQVITSDGGTIHVPIHGPRVGKLEVLPATLVLESAPHQQTEYTPVVLRNRSRKPVMITTFRFGSPEGVMRRFLLDDRDVETIAPGADTTVRISFIPVGPDPIEDWLALLGADGKTFATIRLRGIGTATAATPAGPAPDAAKPSDECPTDDAETKAARAAANKALDAVRTATQKSIDESYTTLSQEWGRYLKHTGLNPSISRAALPDASIVSALLSNAFGNILTSGPGDPMNLRPRVARGIAGRLAGSMGDDVAAAAGLLAGGGVGLVLGVLIETLAGVIFDFLSGGDDEARKAAQDIYDQGRADGGLQVGQRIIDRQAELNAGHSAAGAALAQEHDARGEQISALCDAAALREVTRKLGEEAAQAATARPKAGIASEKLLRIWARDHAAGPNKAGSEVVKAQWVGVTKELAKNDPDHFAEGKLKNQPDLFVSQCLREWESRGLKTSPELEKSIRGAFAANPDQMMQGENSDELAAHVQQMFDDREFVWDRSNVNWTVLGEKLPRANNAGHDDWQTVSCRPSLAVAGGSCFVTSFDYRIQFIGGELEATTRPGQPKWHLPERRPLTPVAGPPPHVESRQLFAMLEELERMGATVQQEADAASNEWLKRTFGDQIAEPETQNADGRAEPVSVFRIVEEVATDVGHRANEACADDRTTLPAAVTDKLHHFTRINVGDYSLFRGGNTILIIKRCGARH